MKLFEFRGVSPVVLIEGGTVIQQCRTFGALCVGTCCSALLCSATRGSVLFCLTIELHSTSVRTVRVTVHVCVRERDVYSNTNKEALITVE